MPHWSGTTRKKRKVKRKERRTRVPRLLQSFPAHPKNPLKWVPHQRDVAKLGYGFAKVLAKKYGLDSRTPEFVAIGGRVHDMGKGAPQLKGIFESTKINLTKTERRLVQKHSTILLNSLRVFWGQQKQKIPPGDINKVIDISRHHHSRWDGRNNPIITKGGERIRIQGEDIPIESRIIGIADFYAAYTEKRPYKKGMPPAEALEIIREQSGKIFDPKLVEDFFEFMSPQRRGWFSKVREVKP